MSSNTSDDQPARHSVRVYRRQASGSLELVSEFVNIGAREAEYLRRQYEQAPGNEHVIELNGELLNTAKALSRPETPGGLTSNASAATPITELSEQPTFGSLETAEARLWGGYQRVVLAAEEALRRTQRLTDMAVQQHEYMVEELRRQRLTYEEDYAAERELLRRLRADWIELTCNGETRIEDVARFIADQLTSYATSSSEDRAENDASSTDDSSKTDAASSKDGSRAKRTSSKSDS